MSLLRYQTMSSAIVNYFKQKLMESLNYNTKNTSGLTLQLLKH